MSLADSLSRFGRFTAPALPTLKPVESTINRILQRWPDIVAKTPERDRETLVQRFRRHLETDDWEEVTLSFVTRVGRILFDPDFRDRVDLSHLLRFFLAETRVSTRPSFLNAMAAIYLDTYEPSASHSVALGDALQSAKSRLGARWQMLLRSCPGFFDGRTAHEAVARLMREMADPFVELQEIGLRRPHGAGLMDHAHITFIKEIRPRLGTREGVDRLIGWIKPDGQAARTGGVIETIEALLSPWLEKDCPPDLRDHLVESLIAFYGDPRLSGATRWAGVGRRHQDLMLRWLTRADMGFFIGVVNATQNSHMWPPRRDFWMRLYDQRRIEAAWVAFSPSAAEYARRHLLKDQRSDNERRFGKQIAGGTRSNTSLLIMKIGRKIVVDGCHNYKTHIFDESDPRAPRLFQARYDCEDIRLNSPRSKAHNAIRNWSQWVELNT